MLAGLKTVWSDIFYFVLFQNYVFNAFSHQLDRMDVFVSVSDPERWNRGSGSTFPKCGSQDPDPRQNEMDPKRWYLYLVSSSAH